MLITQADLESRIKETRTTVAKALEPQANGSDKKIVSVTTTVVAAILRQSVKLDFESMPDHAAIARTIAQSLSSGNKLSIFAPSCPDYKHDGSTYTFGELGSGVSLLGTCQIEFAEKFLPILDIHGIPYDYTVLTADIEAEDDTMLVKNMVTKAEAIERIKETIKETAEYINGLLMPQNGSTIRSTGFLEEFEEFLDLQRKHETLILQLQSTSAPFRKSLERVHEGRLNLYARLFPEATQTELLSLMPRTIRTMAQYAALGNLAREQNAIITSHRTLNIPAYNYTRLFLGKPEDYRRLPVLSFDRRIY